MKKLLWPLLIVLLALIAIGVILLRQPNTLNPITEEEVVVPVTGGIYTEGLVGAFNRLNPILDNNHPADRDIDRLLFSSLIRYDYHGLPVGDLAEVWDTSADGKLYNFSIREDATWHDGEPVRAEDIEFTVELMRGEGSPLAEDAIEMWNSIEMNVVDETTIQFRLPEPFAPFLDYATFGVLPKHLLEDVSTAELINSDFNLKPVGSGPYRFDRLIVEGGEVKGVALKAYEDYYGEKPFIEDFVFRYYPDEQALLAAYQEGEIMGLSRAGEAIFSQVLSEPNLEVHTVRLPRLSLIYLNQDDPQAKFLQDPTIRKAMMMGLNRQWYIDRILNSQAILADGPIFPGTWAYHEGIERVPFNRGEAIELIVEAGYTVPAEGGEIRQNEAGERLALELIYQEGTQNEALAEAIQNDWLELGIEVTLKPMSYEELVVKGLESRMYQAALVDIDLTRSPDPDPYPFWHQTQVNTGQNYAQWIDFQASQYLERARISNDRGERANLYKNFQVRFAQELPALPLFYPVYSYAIDSKVKGVSVGPIFEPSDRFNTVVSWFLLEERAPKQEVTQMAPTATPGQ